MSSAGLNLVYFMYLSVLFIRALTVNSRCFFSSNPPLRNTLSSEEVLTFINTRMLFWACSTSRPEGYRGNHHTVCISFRIFFPLLGNFLHLRCDISSRFENCLSHSLTTVCSVSQALRENTYPFLAMIMLKDRKMTVVGRLEGLIQPEDLINQLNFIMEANQTYLMSERLERWQVYSYA